MNEHNILMPREDMRLPNGYGTVKKQRGRRRYPYAVFVSEGKYISKDGKIRTKYRRIGSTSTREEGIILLNRYHHSNRECYFQLPTFEDVFHMWYKERFGIQKKSVATDYLASFKACLSLHKKVFLYLKTSDLQQVIDTCNKNFPTLRKLATLFRQLYRYAISNDLCDKNYASYIDIKKYKNKNPRSFKREIFKDEDIQLFWSNSDDPYYQMILILIYTGVRVSELLNLKKEDVYLKEQYFDIKASKTDNGIRKVPIADKILPFFELWIQRSRIDYVFTTKNKMPLIYRNYYDAYFMPIMELYGLHQTPHCCRHTFISMMVKANVNPTVVKMIVGHRGAMSITEKVYTHVDMKMLVEAVNKL